MATTIKITECPRDAMQGWLRQIPTTEKAAYINQLMQVGFDTIDFGSYVSPKAIPQMADTAEVLSQLQVTATSPKLLAIVANLRGAATAVLQPHIAFIGYPFSISPTFQLRNTNIDIINSIDVVKAVQNLYKAHDKQLVIYLSMAFGNPYNDAYSAEILGYYTDVIQRMGITIITLADTVGHATPELISKAFTTLIPLYPHVTFGAHIHCNATTWQPKLEAVIQSGCTHIDTALLGIGGCPMAGNALVGNINTLDVVSYLLLNNFSLNLNLTALDKANTMAQQLFVH